jgi:hypothetical protein
MTALRNAAPAEVLERQAEQVDASKMAWSRDQMLAAAQLDAIQQLVHLTAALHGAQGKAPAPTPRPGVAGQKKRKGMTPEQRRVLDPRMRQPPTGGDERGQG